MATDITEDLGIISRAGLTDTLAAIDPTGNTFSSTGYEWIEVENGGGTSTTVSVAYANQVDGQTVPPKTNAVAAGAREKFGPFPTNLFGETVTITYIGNTTDVLIGLFKLSTT
jgi:hypothetical protein